MPIADIDAIDRAAVEARTQGLVEAEKQCKITLAASWPRVVELNWHPGKGGKLSIIRLAPGKSVVQPLSKAQAWFGPFAVPMEYAQTTDENRRDALKLFWYTEKSRVLNRYDYERPRLAREGYEPIGPHRFPDITVTIIEADGGEHEHIRLHEMYKIGEFDPLKDSFGARESADDLRAKHDADLADLSQRYEREANELRLKMAEVAGMVKGMVAATQDK